MIRFLIPTAKEMKTLNEVPYQKISEKSVAILKEMTKLSTEELSTAYKIKPEQAERERSSAGIEFWLGKQGAILQ